MEEALGRIVAATSDVRCIHHNWQACGICGEPICKFCNQDQVGQTGIYDAISAPVCASCIPLLQIVEDFRADTAAKVLAGIEWRYEDAANFPERDDS
jgi:hypothetical protein